MRHQKSGRRFNRDTDARKALMRNLCTSLLESGRITTTEARAKELRRWVERLITTAKAQDIAARRRVSAEVSKPEVVERLFSNLIPRLAARPGGYVSYVGVPHGVELDAQDLFFRHVHLHGGPAPVRRFLPELVDLIWNREIDPGKVFDLTLPLEQAPEGYKAMDERRAIKTLLTL